MTVITTGFAPNLVDPQHNQPAHCEGVVVEFVSAAESPAVMRDWSELDHRIGDAGLMCSSIWTQTWLDHFGDLVPYRFVVGRQDGRVCGVCLLTEGVDQHAGPFRVKTWHIGTAGEPEADSACIKFNRLLVEQNFRTEFVNGLLQLITADSTWDEIRLDGFVPSDAEAFLSAYRDAERGRHGDAETAGKDSSSLSLHSPLPASPRLAVDQSRLPWESREVESHYHDLRTAHQTETDVLSQLGYATRKTIRKNLKTYGPLKTEWAESVEQAESIFADLVRLHQARWTAVGQPGAYASQRFLSFHRDLIRKLIPAEQIGLFRVSRGEEILGCVQLLIDGNRVLCYQGGSAPYGGKLSPGVVIDFCCLEECSRRGFDAYDFMGGNSHHKQRLSTNSSRLIWATLRRPRFKFRLLDAARRLKQRITSQRVVGDQCR